MKLKVNELYGVNEGLTGLLDKELPVRVALSIQRNYKAIEDELEGCEEVRKKIVDKYKEKDNDDGSVDLKPDKIDDYRAEIRELLDQEVEVSLVKLKADEIGDAVAPRTIILLDPILEL